MPWLQDSETPPCAKDQDAPARTAVTDGDSPTFVSPCGDLIAQTGAMLIDDPCIRFSSPRLPNSASANVLANAVTTGHSTDADFDLSYEAVAAPSGINMLQAGRHDTVGHQSSSSSMPQGQVAPLHPFQQSAAGMFPEWMERASPSPEPMNSSPEHIQRPPSSSMSYFHSEVVRPGLTCSSTQVLPVSRSSYFPSCPSNWDLQRAASSFPSSGVTTFPSYDAGNGFAYAPGMQNYPASVQGQNATFMPAYQGAAPHAAHGNSAMEQLALSTAATADLLACMAANSSQASPAPGSHLILAASATIQAFARAAQSTHTAAVAQRGVPSNSAAGVLLTNSALYSHLPEQQQQQMAYLQQWQQRQQQLLPEWPARLSGPY